MRLATSLTKRIVATVAAVALLAVGPPRLAQTQTQADAPPALARLLAAAKSWGYQLQNVDPDEIDVVPYDMLVIDYSRDGSAAEALTAEEVGRLKFKPDGERRIVLSLSLDRRSGDVPLLLEMVLGLVLRRTRAGLARQPEYRVARQLRRPLLAGRLAEDHLQRREQLSRSHRQGGVRRRLSRQGR